MNTKAMEAAVDEISRLPFVNRDCGFADSANREDIRTVISKHFSEPSVPVSELRENGFDIPCERRGQYWYYRLPQPVQLELVV